MQHAQRQTFESDPETNMDVTADEPIPRLRLGIINFYCKADGTTIGFYISCDKVLSD